MPKIERLQTDFEHEKFELIVESIKVINIEEAFACPDIES